MRWAWPQNMLAEVAVPGAGVKALLNQKQKHHSASSAHSPTCAMWAEEKNTHPESHLSSHRKHMLL